MRGVLTGAVLCLTAACGFAARAAEDLKPLQPVRSYKVHPQFLGKDKDGKKDDKIAEDLSGAACAPSGICLAINDQSRFAQPFIIDKASSHDHDGRIKARDPVNIIGKHPSGKTLGTAPALDSCPSKKKGFKDLDGEGVAHAAKYFYVAGSHGCSRKKGGFLLSSFILARIDADDVINSQSGEDVRVETTYRLADALGRAPVVGPYFGKDLKEEDGLNIEGLAIVNEEVFVGLRAPSIKGEAFLVSVPVDALFIPGHDRLSATPEVIPLALGCCTGIRDLAALPNGRLLVLAGPAQNQRHIPYSLFIFEPKAGGEVKQVAILDDVWFEEKGKRERAKAESVTILDPNPLRFLVFFDGLENGGPREYVVPK